MLNEPTVIALNSRTQDVLAMGHEAWQMIGRTPGYIVAVRPLRKGAITDFDITQRMIRLLLQRAGVSRFNRPRVLICVPSAITEVERRAVEEAARGAGANGAYLIEQPMAAAIGAGLPIHEPLGNMVVDVGGGTTETAVISLGGIVALRGHPGRQLRHRRLDPDLRPAGVRHRHRRAHGRGDQAGDRLGLADRRRDQGRGAGPRPDDRPTEDGHPSPEEVRDAIEEQVRRHRRLGGQVSRGAPPELAQDLILQGIHLVGGGGLLQRPRPAARRGDRLPVHLVDAPLECVVLGAGKCLEEFDAVKDLFMENRYQGSGQSAGQVLGGLADLPVPVGQGPFQGGVDLRPPNGARASTARRRTAGLSSVAASTAGSPAGSPMAPRAATAASRHSGSGWSRLTPAQRRHRDAAAVADLTQGEAGRLHHPWFPIRRRA